MISYAAAGSFRGASPMWKSLLVAGAVLALACVAGCSEDVSSGASGGNAAQTDAAAPPVRDDPPIKAPAQWKLERDVVAAMAFSPDGTTLATACDASVIL